MAKAKMSVVELEKFLHEEFPQAFRNGDIMIESADGETCLLRQRYDERMLRPGGTVSGPTPESRGCLLERTWRGKEPIELPSGEKRTFLEEGDEIIMRAWCERPGAVRIGFGECRGIVGEDVQDETVDEVGDDVVEAVAEVAALSTSMEHGIRRLARKRKK